VLSDRKNLIKTSEEVQNTLLVGFLHRFFRNSKDSISKTSFIHVWKCSIKLPRLRLTSSLLTATFVQSIPSHVQLTVNGMKLTATVFEGIDYRPNPILPRLHN